MMPRTLAIKENIDKLDIIKIKLLLLKVHYQKSEKTPQKMGEKMSKSKTWQEDSIQNIFLEALKTQIYLFIHLFTWAYVVWIIAPPCPPQASRQNLFCAFLQLC
jgi:hypothetical protein